MIRIAAVAVALAGVPVIAHAALVAPHLPLPSVHRTGSQATPARTASSPSSTGPRYQPPVEGPITDHFRPPARPYGPGNLGVDWSPPAGTPVRAVAPGTVTFAGQVGGTLHVVVLHGDGIRTTYAFLSSVSVHAGQAVDHTTTVGVAGPDLHLSARLGSVYLDPEALLAGGRPRARLIADPSRPAPG